MTDFIGATPPPTAVPSPTDSDVDFQKRISKELWWRTYPQVRVYLLDKEATVVHPLYLEALDPIYKDPVLTPAYIDHSPSVQKLTKFGINETRDVLVHTNTAIMEDQGWLSADSTFLIGSLVAFDDDFYVVNSQHRDKRGYWINTNVPMFLVLACSRKVKGT